MNFKTEKDFNGNLEKKYGNSQLFIKTRVAEEVSFYSRDMYSKSFPQRVIPYQSQHLHILLLER